MKLWNNRFSQMIDGNNGSTMTFWLVISQLLAAGTAFLVNILAAKVMTPDDRGYLALFLQIGYLVSTIGLFGVERPFASFVKTDFSTALNNMAGLVRPGYLLSVVTALVATIFWIKDIEIFAVSLWIISIFIVANIHSRAIRSAYIASGEWRPFVRNSILIQVSLLFFSVALMALDRGSLHEWLAIYLASNLPAILLVTWKRDKTLIRQFASKELYAKIRLHGLKLIPASLGNAAMLKSDRLLLPFLSTPAELGFYVVAATSMDMASWPIQQWVDGRLHSWRSARQNTTQLLRLFIKVASITLVLVAGCAICVSLLVANVLPSTYVKSQSLLIPLGIAVFIYALTRVLHGQMIVRSIVVGVSVSETVGMILSILLYFLLIPKFGSLGAAYGSIIGYTISLVIGLIYFFVNHKKAESL